MDLNLSEMFAQNQGEPVHVDSRLVHSIYRRTVHSNECLRLDIVSARDAPPQGVRMKLKTGKVQIPGHEPLSDIVLWTNTAPKSVVFKCLTRQPSELRIWNCWRDDRNVMQAWIGNAGLVLEETGKGVVRLSCNSRHELTFQDLVLELAEVESDPG